MYPENVKRIEKLMNIRNGLIEEIEILKLSKIRQNGGYRELSLIVQNQTIKINHKFEKETLKKLLDEKEKELTQINFELDSL